MKRPLNPLILFRLLPDLGNLLVFHSSGIILRVFGRRVIRGRGGGGGGGW
ncbi:hypothetical protein BMS3Abin14_01486 [bacterium BMS3Abin14]|nr:hypothetical protein BMS3Abin14_01486 [bacterium BMS3Abin14]